jgi:hypothetical protein
VRLCRTGVSVLGPSGFRRAALRRYGLHGAGQFLTQRPRDIPAELLDLLPDFGR